MSGTDILSKHELKKIPPFHRTKLPHYNQLEELSLEGTLVHYVFKHQKYNIIWLITHCDVKEEWFYGYAFGNRWEWMLFKFTIMNGSARRDFTLEEKVHLPAPIATVLEYMGENVKENIKQ